MKKLVGFCLIFYYLDNTNYIPAQHITTYTIYLSHIPTYHQSQHNKFDIHIPFYSLDTCESTQPHTTRIWCNNVNLKTIPTCTNPYSISSINITNIHLLYAYTAHRILKSNCMGTYTEHPHLNTHTVAYNCTAQME